MRSQLPSFSRARVAPGPPVHATWVCGRALIPRITILQGEPTFMRPIFPEMKFSAVITLGLVLLFGFAQIASAQAPTPLPLSLDNNYMVTGDYVVGGWTKTGSTTINGTLMSTGTISIPDQQAYVTNMAEQVPAGADIVAAFLYWQTVENSGVHSGQSGFFNTYPISGTVLGNPKAPVSWSS